MTLKDISEAVATLVELSQTEVTPPTDLPFELIGKRHRKTTKLVANSNEVSSLGYRHRWFDYDFEEPVFLAELIVEVSEAASFQSFEFKWTAADGEESEVKLTRHDESTYRCKVNQLVRSVAFRPPSNTWKKREIQRVKLIGFKAEQIEDLVSEIDNLENLKERIVDDCEEALNNARAANQNLADLASKATELQNQIDAKQKETVELKGHIAELCSAPPRWSTGFVSPAVST